MTTTKLTVGTRTSLTTSAMDSLASGAYVNCGTLTLNTNSPVDCLIEVKATPGTVSGNKQLLVFTQGSLDGTNFESGPTSGTTTTDEPNLTFVGIVPLNTSSTAQIGLFSLAAAFGGVLPHSAKVIVKNDSGATLASSGHSVYYSEVAATTA